MVKVNGDSNGVKTLENWGVVEGKPRPPQLFDIITVKVPRRKCVLYGNWCHRAKNCVDLRLRPEVCVHEEGYKKDIGGKK
jgi:hypothetical protein